MLPTISASEAPAMLERLNFQLRGLYATADRDGRTELTPEEQTRITELEQQIRQVGTAAARRTSEQDFAAAITRQAGPSSTTPPRGRPLSLGEQFVQAEQYEFFKKGGHHAAAWRSPAFDLYAPDVPTGGGGRLMAVLSEDPASGGALVIPQYLPGVLAKPTRPLVVADLFAQGSTSSNAITFMVETLFTHAAAAVAEGAAKPESALTFAPATETVHKLAHWLPVTEEMLEDVPAIRSYIDSRLRTGVEITEDQQLLTGDGAPPNMLGLLNRVGLATPIAVAAGGSVFDAILKQAAAIYNAQAIQPDALVMNPADLVSLQVAKDTTGQYLGGSPFTTPSTTIWSFTVAVTPLMTQGQILVGAFKAGGQVFRKGGIRVEASNSHQDFFVKNLVAIRAEERLALAVYRPGAFGLVTGVPALP